MLQVVFFELVELIHPLEVHEHFFHEAVIDRIVFRKMVIAVLGGKRIEIDALLAVNLNYGNIVYESQISVSEALVDIQIDYSVGQR